ncbi:MAG: NAD(+) synthase [Dorea sp.]|nr:NAD(+) synthase [Dorea sp.]
MKNWNQVNVNEEIERITAFIQEFVYEQECVVVPVSGGIDSDIVARLCCKSIGKNRVKLFIVIQSEMEGKFLVNARMLAEELKVPLTEIHLEQMNLDLMRALEKGEKGRLFRTDVLLDPAKAKCSVRSAVISSYQDKGFLIAGTTNKTEKKLGFFLTFGDNIAHFKPIAHLYKTELKGLARALGTSEMVIEQEPSAGFWEGQTDLEDFAYWIVNDGPIVFPREFSEIEVQKAERIKNELTQGKIDDVLILYEEGYKEEDIIKNVALSKETIRGLLHIVDKAKILKSRTIMAEIQN